MKVKPWALAVLAICLAFCMFSGTAFGASARYAVVTEVVGTVTVTKAGGSLEIPVVTGMALNEGDRLNVGKGGSLTLKTADSEDEIVLGENWRGTLSKLRENDKGGTDTAIKTWAGSMYNHVQKLSGTDGTYKVETPTSVMNVRGTHFSVVVDPHTGLVKMIVNAGVVQTGSDSPDDPGVPVLPSQQATRYPGLDNWTDLSYIAPEDFSVSVDPEVIAKLLKNKALIDQENDELLNNIDEIDEESNLNLLDQEMLARYRANVENSLAHILKAAAEAGKLDKQSVEDIIETVNQAIKDQNKQFNLEQDLPPIDRTAGIDPVEEERRRQQREQAEKSLQERQQQKDEIRENVRDDAELLDRIEKKKEAQEEANRQAEEEQLTKAREEYSKQPDEEQRNALKEKRQERESEDRRRDVPDDPIATSTSIELSDSSIVYGQTFTITAEVKSSNSRAVPDGGRVDFKIGASVIGSGTIVDGKATFTVDKEKWASPELSGIQIGLHNVSAVYAGVAKKYGSSTSPVEALSIARADTIVELSVTPDPPEPGDILEIQVNVAVKPPGGGEPTGTVTLYRLLNDEWQPVGEPIYLEPGMQSVSFQDSLLKETGLGEMQYKAEFVSDNEKHNNGVSEVKEVVLAPTEPIVLVKKVVGDESDVFEIHIDLANFTVTNAVYGAELHFQHTMEIGPDFVDYNRDKFVNENEVEHSVGMKEEYVNGQYVMTTIFEFRLIDRDYGVEFSTLENMAKIVFRLYESVDIDDVNVDLVYWQFTNKDGETIDVNVQPGVGVIINPINPINLPE